MKLSGKLLFRLKSIMFGLIHLKNTIKIFNLFSKSVFVIYSNGHTGSTTVYYNLMEQLPFVKVFHVHLLSKSWLKMNKTIEGDRNEKLRHKFLKYKQKHPKKKYYHITLVRDPIDRAVSSFFYNKKYKNLLAGNLDQDLSLEIFEKEIDFEKNYLWFDYDYNDYFNTNYLNIEFENSKGYLIKKFNNNLISLIIRTDKLNEAFHNAFIELTGFTLSRLRSFNERSQSSVGEYYKKFKEKIKLSDDLLSKYRESHFVNKFFTIEEIEKKIKKYKKN